MFSRFWAILAVLFSLVFPKSVSAFYMEAGLPLYVYPSAGQVDWAAASAAGGAKVGFIIANVHNGPGSSAQSDWTRVIQDATAKGIAIYGYVYTSYGTRNPAEVEADIARWFNFYPQTSGIFFDETASGTAQLPYYQARYNFVKQLNPNFQVVINPGTVTDEGYMTACDVNTIFESDLLAWNNRSLPSWVGNYPEDRFYAIVYNVPSQGEMEVVVTQAKAANFGKIFVTSAPTPSASLPTYFSAELNAILAQRTDVPPPSPILEFSSSLTSLYWNKATFSVSANMPSTAELLLGTSPTLLSSRGYDGNLVTSHNLAVSGLKQRTTYYYRIVATSFDGQKVSSPVFNFRTPSK